MAVATAITTQTTMIRMRWARPVRVIHPGKSVANVGTASRTSARTAATDRLPCSHRMNQLDFTAPPCPPPLTLGVQIRG